VTGFPGRENGSRPPVTGSPRHDRQQQSAQHRAQSTRPFPDQRPQDPATAADDDALEASIRAKGILQNLIVHPTPIDGKGIYEVTAGGRRLGIPAETRRRRRH
jgi:hypothetical protein